MSRVEKREAEGRMLGVLLAEEFGGQFVASADDTVCNNSTVQTNGTAHTNILPSGVKPPDWQATSPGPRWRTNAWPAAAALLLGIGVVTLAMSTDRLADTRVHAIPLQDPKAPQFVTANTVEEFLTFLGQAKRLQLVRKETVGAGRVSADANGSGDRLDTVRWPEVLRIEGEEFAHWQDALSKSCRQTKASATMSEVYDFELVLPDNRLLRMFASFGGKSPRIWIAKNHPMVPDEQLLALIEKACKDANELRRVALGKVHERSQLLALPEDSKRLDVEAEHLLGPEEPACLAWVQRLTLRGEPSAAVWHALTKFERLRHLELVGATMHDATVKAVAGMSRLQSLALRQCLDFSSDDLRALGALRELHTLHLIDTSPDGDEIELQELASLPVLREFGLRARHALTDEQLNEIGRTKIERLLLVDLNMQGDLSHLAHLPSLEDLVLVANVGDQYLQPLSQIDSLQLLTVRNASASGSFLTAIMSEVPECEIDWTKNARWWQTDYAFRYIERTWPVR